MLFFFGCEGVPRIVVRFLRVVGGFSMCFESVLKDFEDCFGGFRRFPFF